MLNWIKYSPLKLRSTDALSTIKGPSVSGTKRKHFSVDGNQLSFLWPGNSWFMPSDSFDYFSRSYSLADLKTSSDRFNGNWQYLQPAYSHWRFDGPWFTGRLAYINASIFVLSPVSASGGIGKGVGKGVSGDVSLFHPKAFEFAVSQLLSDFREQSLHKGRETYIAPNNWRVVNKGSIPAARFEDVWEFQSDPIVNYCQALSEQALVLFSFSINSPERGRWINGLPDKYVDRSVMFDLIDRVIDSISVNLSEDNQARLREQEALCSGVKLSDSFPPIDWENKSTQSIDSICIST